MKKLVALFLTIAMLVTSMMPVWAEDASTGESTGEMTGEMTGDSSGEAVGDMTGDSSGEAAGEVAAEPAAETAVAAEDASSGEAAGEVATEAAAEVAVDDASAGDAAATTTTSDESSGESAGAGAGTMGGSNQISYENISIADYPADAPIYTTDYNSMEEAQIAAETLTAEIAAEGAALLKNENDALPLAGNAWISVFGVTEQGLEGSGSSTRVSVTVSGALADAGFNVNPVLHNYYAANYAVEGNNSSVGSGNSNIGLEDTTFNAQVINSFKVYNDAAIVVFSRTGAEGSDAKRITTELAGVNMLGENDADTHVALYTDANGNTYKHYLMLTESERELLRLVEANFDTVIVLLNTANYIETDELKFDENIDAIMNIGRPGAGGLNGIAKLLNGTISPSGGLVDEWYSDFTADPTWYNFGSNDQTGGLTGGAGSNTYMDEDGVGGAAGSLYISDEEGYHGVDYEEGIYNGYRFYETYYTDLYNYLLDHPEATATIRGVEYTGTDIAQAWHERYVAYPFGYGLNYTTFAFEQGGIYTDAECTNELTDTSLFASTAEKAAEVEVIYVPVKVTNTGSMAGKKTVQAYITYDSYSNQSVTEHAAVTLVGYAKSGMIQPGESEIVVVAINVQDMASWYSYQLQSDGETYGAYILEAGDYTLRLMEDSHFDMATDVTATDDAYDEVKFNVASTIATEQDDFSGGQLSALFTSGLNNNGDGYTAETELGEINHGNIRSDEMMADGSGMTVLTRNSGISAEARSATENTYTGANKDELVFSTRNYSGEYVPINPLGEVVINGFDLSFPKAPTASDLTFHNEVLNAISYWDNYNVSSTQAGARDNTARYQEYFEVDDDKGYAWSKTSVPENWTQAKGTYGQTPVTGSNTNQLISATDENGNQLAWMYTSSDNAILLKDMIGVAWDDPKWDEFLNQLTFDELAQMMVYNGWGSVSMISTEKPSTTAADSPTNYESTHQWTSADIMAATWNVDLAYREGVIMGNLILLKGNTEWLGPGADHHRSPFSGRNNEYFSSDGLQGGMICAAVINGAREKGIVCYTKHVFMNDQETDRGVHFAWCDEQAIREVYSRAFQWAFQEGGSNAGMTGYARLGGLCNTSNYNLGVMLYQQEWGTQAPFTTDGWIGWDKKTSPDAMIRAGNQTILTTSSMEYLSGMTNPETGSTATGGFYKAGEELPDGTIAEVEGVYLAQHGEEEGTTVYKICYTQWYWTRSVAKSILYAEANSAAFKNGYWNINYGGEELVATEGVTFNGSAAIDSGIRNGSTVVYTMSGTLPAGLSFDSNTGAITGTATETGTFTFTVDYLIDGWISKSGTNTLTVKNAIAIVEGSDDFATAKVGTEFVAEFTSDVITIDAYDSLTYSVEGEIPAGMVMYDDGTLEGTPEVAGEYSFSIKLLATKESTDKKGSTSVTETAVYLPVTMIVAE